MDDLNSLLGKSPAMEALRATIARLARGGLGARRPPPVLLEGETGAGKGLVAGLLHRIGPRASRPFIDVNCAAIPDTLLESELFGFEQGAFTDARRAKAGLFQSADGGTLFLDEVGLLTPLLQAKLLKVLEEQAVRRLGSTRTERVDVWVISASNIDLAAAVADGGFRSDLYHRLAVVTLSVPPLRDRGDDVVVLAEHFLARACRDYGLPALTLAPDAHVKLRAYAWPGNVRELANTIERSALLCDSSRLTAPALRLTETVAEPATPAPAIGQRRTGSLDDVMRDHVLAVLEQTGGNISRSAALLGIARNTLRAHMSRLGLRPAPRERGSRSRPTACTAARTAPLEPTVTLSPPPSMPPPAPSLRWERRRVTLLRVVFGGGADGSIDAAHLVSLAADKVAGFGGRIERLGSTLLDASFGVGPIENPTRWAVSAALAIQRAVADAARLGFTVTTVVHAAETTVGQMAGNLVIDDADRTSLAEALDRLRECVDPGAVHVSAQTVPFLERHFELQRHEPSGSSAEPVFTVVRRDPTGLGLWRRLTRFVGRETEMDFLRSRWELARAGRGQVVGLVGDAGAGKSRLLLEFTRTLDPTSALLLRMATSAIDDPSRARPAAALVGVLFGVEPGDGPAEIRDKLATRLRALELEEALVPPLAALLDLVVDDAGWAVLNPEQRARRMLDALRRLIVRESVTRPIVIVVDDLHWIDADTQVVLDHLIDVVSGARILFVVTYRPEYRHGWTGRTFYTQFPVDSLPARAADELLDDLLGSGADLAALKQQLSSWTEGNPFFLEEAVWALVAMGSLAGTPGSYRATGEIVADALPPTVEDTLAARIHRLPPDTRHVLQCAAVVGTDFPVAVLAALAEISDASLAEHLRLLQDAELVYAATGTIEPTYRFKHALTHVVTYRRLPPERQRALHAQALRAIETLYAGQLEAQTEALAEHAFRGEAWEKAGAYLHAAGVRARGRSANRTAVDYLERAIIALDRAEQRRDLRERAIDVRLDLRYALLQLEHTERVLPHLREAEVIAAELDDSQRLGRVVSFLANGLYVLGDHDGAIAAARRAKDIAERSQDFSTRVTADIYAGRALYTLGRFREANDLFRGVIDALTGEHANDYAGLPVLPSAYARSYLGLSLTELGEFESAAAIGREAVAIAEATRNPDSIQWACYALGVAALERGDVEGAIASLERALSICRAAELPVYVPRTSAALGHAYALAGRADGVVLVEEAAGRKDITSQRNNQARILARLAEVYTLSGKLPDAAERAARSLSLARERGERASEAHALCALAAAHASGSRADESRSAYETALTLAEALGMRPVAARCRLGLGKLARAAGQVEESQRHLAAAEEAFVRLGMTRWERNAAAERALLP